MGLLDTAKKAHEKKKKHPAAEAPEANASAEDQSQDQGEQSAQADSGEDGGGNPSAGASQGGAAPGAGAGGTADSPQMGGNQPTGSGEDQGSDEDESESSQTQGQDEGQQGGPDGGDSGGDQSQAPEGGNSDDDTSQNPGDQPDAQQVEQETGESPQDLQKVVGPDGEPDFSKIPLPPALSAELDKAKQALNQALYSNDKVARAVLQAVVPGEQLPAAAAHMTLVIVSSINKKLMFSKNAPQLVLPIVQLTLNHILDMVEQVRKTQIPDQQAVGALGLAQEGVMRMFGVSKQQVANLKSHLPPSMVSKYQAHYKNAHAYATSGQKQGGDQSGGPAQGSSAAAPQQGSDASPQASSPPGGMVSQGAQAAQQQGGGSQPDQEEQEENE